MRVASISVLVTLLFPSIELLCSVHQNEKMGFLFTRSRFSGDLFCLRSHFVTSEE